MGSSRVFSPYQLVHLIKLLANKEDGLLICDGVGVGKTISAGYILSYHQLIRKGDAAVVCPPVLTQKWRIELRDKFNLPTVLVASPDALSSVDEETQANAERSKPRIYVIPYSLLSRLSLDHPSALSLIVFDEIHAIRNPETQTYASALVLAQGAKQRIGLTATPIHNKLDDLASELSVLFPRYALEVLKVAISEIWATKKTELLHPWTTRFVKDKLSIHFTKRVIENRFVRYPENYTRRVEDVLDGTVHAQGRQRMSSQFDVSDLVLDPENPRFFYLKLKGKGSVTEAELQEEIERDDTLPALVKAIRASGVEDPIWVREADGKYVVVEGNRRTVVLRHLLKEGAKPTKDGVTYKSVKAFIIPRGTSPTETLLQKARLQTGKKDWGAFNVAAVTYILRHQYLMELDDIATEMQTSIAEVKERLANYKLFQEYVSAQQSSSSCLSAHSSRPLVPKR